ncbi:DUF2304 domain-containing protein [Embleya scabrispora]|uniref:DUF2304 domain-containing protein n=1 Tax=Embleya scabrispora TaxID=159449 RepID=A0A1T3NTG8_9ACTN|nr:DUF2304 domain-containing protein [Embleya scabrispora]OPC79921.1 DUF2304 domain-containing protein [Embleya scabrispora]
MVLSISGVLLLGVIAYVLFRKDGLRIPHALVCALFGFYLAGSSIAPHITASSNSIANLLSGITF